MLKKKKDERPTSLEIQKEISMQYNFIIKRLAKIKRSDNIKFHQRCEIKEILR